MRLTVLKPNEDIVDATVDQVTLPCALGQITPMDGHDRVLSTTDGGLIYFILEGEGGQVREEYNISPGVIEITHDSVNILVEHAERVKGGDIEG